MGNVTQDAHCLIKILEKDSNLRRSFYQAEFPNNKFSKCCYISRRMKALLNKFSDVLISVED